MMEIKFKYLYKSQWFFVDLYRDNTAIYFDHFERRSKTSIFLQFTGVKDSTNTDIYVGDVIKIGETYHLVKFEHCYFECYPMKAYANTLNRFHDESVIIGNIINRPDLKMLCAGEVD